MFFELRVYHANRGKITELLSRFRDHTVELFARHNMESVGYWIDEANPDDLIYIPKHSGDPEINWQAFRDDKEWIAAKSNSEVNGVLVASIDSHFMQATDFSALK